LPQAVQVLGSLNVATSFDEEEVAFPEPDGDEIEGGDEVGDEGEDELCGEEWGE
jgi:hypothetical protein